MSIPYEVREKFVLCGQYVEHYIYEIPYYKNFPRFQKNIKHHNHSKVIRIDNVIRAKQKIRRLINSNPDMNKFLTLTYSTETTELKTSNYNLNKFMKRLKRDYPDLKYLAVPEYMKNNRVHYHILSNLPFVSCEVLRTTWQNGFVFIRKINNLQNVGVYISKYLSKHSTDARFSGKKKYFTSRNLLKPITVDKSDEIIKLKQVLPLEYKQFAINICKFDYCSDFLGMIQYNQYKISEMIKVGLSTI